MDATTRERIDAIDWSRFCTAYGPAVAVPDQLRQLLGGGPEAMDASHHLWCGLCHQHAYVSSAAMPALPFILEALERADEALTVEILDILLGFASCTRPDLGELPAWAVELRHRLIEYLPRLRGLAAHPNDQIADFARLVIEHLEIPAARRVIPPDGGNIP